MNSKAFVSTLYVIGLAVSVWGATSNAQRYLALNKGIAAYDVIVEKSKAFDERTDKEFKDFYRTQPNGNTIIEMHNMSQDSARFSQQMDRQSLVATQTIVGDAAFLHGMASLIFGLLIVGARKTHAR